MSSYMLVLKNLTMIAILCLGACMIAFAQPKPITKTEYAEALQKATDAMTYPYRETVRFEPFTSYESSEAASSGDGVDIQSQVVVIEYYSADRLRITSETKSENGLSVKRQMQINSDCYTLVGRSWKKNVDSCNPLPLTGEMQPLKEEYFVEDLNISGFRQRTFRQVKTKSHGPDEASFTVDDRGRLIKRAEPGSASTYDYGVRIEPVKAPNTKNRGRRRHSR